MTLWQRCLIRAAFVTLSATEALVRRAHRAVQADYTPTAGECEMAQLAFVACLASGRGCLTFDNEGAARLTVELAQPEAAKLAARLDELMDTTFAMVCQPLKG